MDTETSSQDRLVMAITAAIAGLLLITVVPWATMSATNSVLTAAYAKIAATQNQSIVWAPKLVSFFFPFWGALSMVGGAGLLLLVVRIYQGQRWARAVAVGILAIPSIAGAYMIGPIMFFAQSAAMRSVIIMLCGLIPYFTILLAERSALKVKIANFLVFLTIGVSAAYNWANGHSSLRQLLARPDSKVFNFGHQTWAMGLTINWAATVLILIGIPLMANRSRSGWLLSVTGSLSLIIGSGLLALGHPSTIEFQAGVAMALLSLVLLMLPRVSGHLKNETL